VAGSPHLDQAAQDDAHLQSLGIKPELQRTLGFLSNFAVAFSYISVSTGTFTLIALGLGVAGPAFFWSWPIVILGQTFVALNFAELSSHFPVAGSIYQWSKRLANKTLGWFTGWIYFWAGVLTTTAVAITVPLVLGSILNTDLSKQPFLFTNMQVGVALLTLVVTTVINAFGVRLLSLINNIGVGAEILGMLVFALILLVLHMNQPVSVLTTNAGTDATNGNYLPLFLVGMFMSLFVVFGFDTAGTFGEETVGASKQAPRGILSAIWISGVIGAIFLLAIILSTPDMNAALTDPTPIATSIKSNLGEVFGSVYLWVIFVAVSVCTLAIQGATSRLMFSMGRDRRLPLGGVWAHVNPTFKTPANSAIAVGILAGVPLLVTDSPFLLAGGATGLIYISYFLCNLGVFLARTKGWPRGKAWFSLGGWGTVINLLALVWGGVMIINFALWNAPDWFGDFAAMRDLTNPLINGLSFFGSTLDWLPAIPIFEATLGILIVAGAVVYAIGERMQKVGTDVEADAATGEVAIA
jgi:urea carboxylase system permease